MEQSGTPIAITSPVRAIPAATKTKSATTEMKTVTPNQINHGTRAFGIGNLGPHATGTLHQMTLELRRLKGQRHSSIPEPALEADIALMESRVAAESKR